MKVNKDKIAREISIEEFLPINLANEIIDAIFHKITKYMADGDTVVVTGFGKFEPVEMKPRKGRDIHTGEEVDIPARIYPKFTPGATLKKAVIKELEG